MRVSTGKELCLAALLVRASPLAGAQASPEAARLAAAKQELRQMWDELNEARRTRNLAAIERIYTEEFVFVHLRAGGVVNRTDNLKGAVPPSPSAALPMPNFDKIQLFGEVAVLRSPAGNVFTTAIYAKRQGRWQIIQLRGTPLASPRQAVVIDPKVLASYAGKYEQAPGRFAATTVQGERLRIVFPNAIAWTLRPSGNDRFFVPDNLNQIMFHRTGEGRI